MIVVVFPMSVMTMVGAIVAVPITEAFSVAITEMGSALIAVAVLVFGEGESTENQAHAQKNHET